MDYNKINKIIYIIILIIILSLIIYYNYENKKIIHNKYDNVNYINTNNINNITSNLELNNVNLKIIEDNDEIVKNVIDDNNKRNNKNIIDFKYNFNKNIEYNNDYLKKNITSNINNLDNINIYGKEIINEMKNNYDNIQGHNNNIITLDNNLRDYFNFKEDGELIKGKLLDYQFNPNKNRNIDINVETNYLNNLIIKKYSKDNLRICENDEFNEKLKNCINISVNNNTFNIKPDNKTNGLYIRRPDRITALLHLDMLNNNIYIGGEDNITAPFYIKNNITYIKKLKADIVNTSNVLYNKKSYTLDTYNS